MRQVGDFAIEPQMDARNRRMLQLGRGQTHRFETLERKRADGDVARAALAIDYEAFGIDAFHRGAMMNVNIGQALPGIGAVKLRQRNSGHAHFVGIGAWRGSHPENLETVEGGHTVQIFVDGAHQHLPPEAVDGARRLALLQQPVEHADAVEIFAARAFAAQRGHGARDADLVGARKGNACAETIR